MRLEIHVLRQGDAPAVGGPFGPFAPGSVAIGRGSGCDVQLDDPSASRKHCRIDVTAVGVRVVDLGSRWGTRVNGEPVPGERTLVDGDEILVGDTTLRVEIVGAVAHTTIPPKDHRPAVTVDVPRNDVTLDRVPADDSDGEDARETLDQTAPIRGTLDATARNPEVPGQPTRAESSPTDTAPPTALPAPRKAANKPSPRSGKGDDGPIPPPMDLRDLVGRTLVRYEIRGIVAEARTGVLFEARDTKYERKVALKVLWPELTKDETEVARFVRAFQTMIGFRHPGLVRLHGAGKTGSYCWTASEFVDGENLERAARRRGVAGMLDWRLTLRIALDVARGLEAAEEHGIVHRNVTPTNVLVTKEDRAKLGDVALAKAVEGSMVQKVTRSGDVVGEIALAAPEQLQGLPEDTRTDVYNLGATLYFALAGRTPFERPSVGEMATAIQHDKVEPPSRFQLSIPGMLDQLIVQMLSKRREDRPSTPHRLVRELDRIARFNNVDVGSRR